MFDLQDRITPQIVAAVAPTIRAPELQAALRKRPESLTACDRMLATPPNAVSHRGIRESGSLADARTIAGDLMRLEPEFRLATVARRRQPFRQPETGAAYLEGLRAAGLPD